jgi:CspA family cold shock protein
MQEGTVKWFNTRKGYGFICTSDGRDIFVHYSNIVGDGYRSLIEGDIVTFDIAEGEKGLRAENVVQKSASQTKTGSESDQTKTVSESDQTKTVPESE